MRKYTTLFVVFVLNGGNNLKNKLIWGIDVDLVVAPSDLYWIYWMDAIYGDKKDFTLKSEDAKFNYDTAMYYQNFKEITGVDPYIYWDEAHLYDVMQPIPGSVETLRQIKEDGNNIVFISYTKGDHMASKVRFLKRHYPFVEFNGYSGDGFIATKEKGLVSVDVMVDDRANNLHMFKEEVIKIFYNTIWADNDFKKERYDLVTSVNNPWEDIKKFYQDIRVN